jgi:hypothetical protein
VPSSVLLGMAYRDDRDALRSRRDELQKDLADLVERAAALESLVKSREGIERELADIDTRLARAASERRSLLDAVRIASPCGASWEAMRGDERVRFCDKCHKNVYNLSAMSRDEAEALIVAKDGDLCARIYQRADGTVMSADCPVGAKKKRVRRLAMAVTGAGVLAGMAGVSALTAVQGQMVAPIAPAAQPEMVELEPDPTPAATSPGTGRHVMGGMRPRPQDLEPAKGSGKGKK